MPAAARPASHQNLATSACILLCHSLRDAQCAWAGSAPCCMRVPAAAGRHPPEAGILRVEHGVQCSLRVQLCQPAELLLCATCAWEGGGGGAAAAHQGLAGDHGHDRVCQAKDVGKADDVAHQDAGRHAGQGLARAQAVSAPSVQVQGAGQVCGSTHCTGRLGSARRGAPPPAGGRTWLDRKGLSVAAYRNVICSCSSVMTSCRRCASRAASGSVWLHACPALASCVARPCQQDLAAQPACQRARSWLACACGPQRPGARPHWVSVASPPRTCQAGAGKTA